MVQVLVIVQDEEIIPNPDNVGSSLGQGVSRLDESFDPSNFLKTQTFGLAPSNTTLTVVYNYGGKVEHNVASNSIISFTRKIYTISTEGLDATKKSTSEVEVVLKLQMNHQHLVVHHQKLLHK